ncbi:MAG: hypothetical protein ACR2PW_00470 [Gammaproteobacteria bacterium]
MHAACSSEARKNLSDALLGSAHHKRLKRLAVGLLFTVAATTPAQSADTASHQRSAQALVDDRLLLSRADLAIDWPDLDTDQKTWVKVWLTSKDLHHLMEALLHWPARSFDCEIQFDSIDHTPCQYSYSWTTLLDLDSQPHAGIISGARISWNPWRPPYDRVYLIQTEPQTSDQQLRNLTNNQSLVSLAAPVELLRHLANSLYPWLPAPVWRQRSGEPVSLTALLEDSAWRFEPEAATNPPVQSVANTSGFIRARNLHWNAWFARSSVNGWLTGMIALGLLALMMLLASSLWARLTRLYTHLTNPPFSE